jgi:hypothetical protein
VILSETAWSDALRWLPYSITAAAVIVVVAFGWPWISGAWAKVRGLLPRDHGPHALLRWGKVNDQRDEPVPHDGASEEDASVWHDLTEELAALPADLDPAVHQAPLMWWELPAREDETAPLYLAIPLPVLELDPDDLSFTRGWNRAEVLAKVQQMEESR